MTEINQKLTFGDRLRQRREAVNLTREGVADMIHIGSAQTLANWETNKREPNFDTLIRLCRLYDATPNELFGFEGFDPDLFTSVVEAVDRFLHMYKREMTAEVKARTYLALYDAISTEPAPFQRLDGALDIERLSNWLKLGLPRE